MSKYLALPALACLAALTAAPARGQLVNSAAVAQDADLVAVYSPVVERRLMRLGIDRATGRVTLAPFAETRSEVYAVAPRGAFTVHAGTGEDRHTLHLLDAAGKPLGTAVETRLGTVTALAVSAKGDAVAAGNARGWIAVYAVTGAGAGRRLAERAVFGAAPAGALAFAFRPEGGIATMTQDGTVALRGPEGRIESRVKLKRILADGESDAGFASEGFALRVSPRGDRFATVTGDGPFALEIFDRTGRRLTMKSTEQQMQMLSIDAFFVAGGAKLLVYGMEKPRFVDMATLEVSPMTTREILPSALTPLADRRGILGVDDDGAVILWDESGKLLHDRPLNANVEFRELAAGAGDEAIATVVRGGLIDLYSKDGKYLRRLRTQARGAYGGVALAADGALAAFGNAAIAFVAASGEAKWNARFDRYGTQDFHVATAADGSRIATAGPDSILRSWTAGGAADGLYDLRDGERKPRRLFGLAVSPKGDALAVADEDKALWLAFPEGKRVRRVALPAAARTVAALPDGSGFAVGLVDGTVVRIGRDGAPIGAPVKAAPGNAVGRLAIATDGSGFVAVESDDAVAHHFAWDGKELSPQFRARYYDRIVAVHFRAGVPIAITAQRSREDGEAPQLYTQRFGDPGHRQFRVFERPKP